MNKPNSLKRGLATLALCAIVAIPTACSASSPGGADVQGFTLSDSFLAKYQAVELDIAKDPCRLGFVKLMGLGGGTNADNLPLAQAAARYDAQPGVHAMLAKHGLTAHDMLSGVATLTTAAMLDLRQTHPDMVEVNGQQPVSAANMAFYRTHKNAIHQFAMRVGQEQLRANGGKLPACMR